MSRFRLAWVAIDRPGEHEVVFPQQGTVRIGRAATNDLVILDDYLMSRHHAVAEISGDEFLIDCLEAATNPLLYRGEHRRLRLSW